MSDNPNDFFTETTPEPYADENSSASGIAYGDGEKASAASTRTIMAAIGIGALFAGLLMLVLSPGRRPEPTNTADIPTLSSNREIKFAPEDAGTESALDSASIYGRPVDFDEEAKKLLNKPEVRPEPLPPLPVKVAKKAEARKPAAPVQVKKPAPPAKTGPEFQIVEEKTPVNSELAMVDKAVFGNSAQNAGAGAGGPWHVQLASSSSEAAAKAEWQNLSKKYPQILGSRAHTVEAAAVGGRTFYRLRISGLANSAEASELCAKLKAYGVACFVTK